MGKIRPALPAKLFVSVLTSIREIMPEVERCLAETYGLPEQRSETFPFDQTHYYDEEMGTPLSRVFLSFPELISPDEIALVKIRTNQIEASLAERFTSVSRPANLDPGYVDQAKVVLASTKDFSHRIMISNGIYAEVTLHYQGGQWRSWPWTFPDFRTGRYNGFFAELRENYRNQIRQMQAGSHD